MKAQDVDLSPRKILSYLVDFEKKLPRRDYVEYSPSVIGASSITEDALNREARLMLDFVGLTSCVPECRFCEQDANVGGSINLSSDTVVRIYVHNNLRNNPKAVLGVLAHEICHKLLFNYQIYFPDIPYFNEIYTDLCTLYVGFGKLVLQGYITNSANSTQYLGYLKFDVYKSCYAIIKATRDNCNGLDIDDIEDFYIRETVSLLRTNGNLRELFLNVFMQLEDNVASFNRNCAVFNGMLAQIQKKANTKLSYFNEIFFGNENLFASDKTPLLPLHIFSILYEAVLKLVEKEDEMEFKANGIMGEVIVKLIDIDGCIELPDETAMTYECPMCGNSFKGKKYYGNSAVLKCMSCKKNFYYNCEEFNVVRERRRIKEKETAYIESRVQQSISDVRNSAYRNGVAAATLNFETRIKKAEQALPSWLRWIVKWYVKEV